MMALNVVKELCGVGRLRAAKAGDRQGLVVADGGSGRMVPRPLLWASVG